MMSFLDRLAKGLTDHNWREHWDGRIHCYPFPPPEPILTSNSWEVLSPTCLEPKACLRTWRLRPEYLLRVEDEISFVEGVGFPKAGDGLVRLQGLMGLYTTVLRAEGKITSTVKGQSWEGPTHDFTGLETYTVRVLLRKKNTIWKIQKLVSKVMISLECKKKLQQITNF